MIIINRRNLLWLVPLFLFLSSPVWEPPVASFLKPRGGYNAGQERASGKQAQDFVMDALTLTMSSKGRIEWVIKASRAFTGKRGRMIDMIDVDAVYTGAGRDRIYIASKRGQYNIDRQHLILQDNVRVRKPLEKQELYTDLLHYYDRTKQVICPGDVKIKGPDFSIQAGHMKYDLLSHAYDFSKGVVCRF
ncbi:lipopolysaccharide-assembly, LptC-related [bacterium BMS3Abin13]|nr:lipopolysaccharide-assembly, LptC-related [bacterium BMS3Abin13]